MAPSGVVNIYNEVLGLVIYYDSLWFITNSIPNTKYVWKMNRLTELSKMHFRYKESNTLVI